LPCERPLPSEIDGGARREEPREGVAFRQSQAIPKAEMHGMWDGA
jgi:hypothetical protein